MREMASAVFAVNNQRGLSLPSFSPASSTSPFRLRSPATNRCLKLQVFWKESEKPTSIDMLPISTLHHFDELRAQPHPFVIDWMANWCRKCIYLKPKLEKLAAEFYPTIKFYYVDVNEVPKGLVERGGVSKMPTIQIWKDGEMAGEVIGGHKAWLVVDEVREMIQKTMKKK